MKTQPRWSKYFYLTTCQHTRANGYRHLECVPSDYMNFTPQADNRRGLYFGATQSPSKDLEIGAFQQVAWLLGLGRFKLRSGGLASRFWGRKRNFGDMGDNK